MAQALNRSELIRGIKPFADFLLTLRSDKPIPILRDLAVLVIDSKTGVEKLGILKRKINRLYYRLCRIQQELSVLDFKKAKPGVSPEDHIFSGIDFSRYRGIAEADFENFFLEGLADFPEFFFETNFSLGKDGLRSLINECYENGNGIYKLKREDPVILSAMRTLEISLDTSPLFTSEEIKNELDFLRGIVGAKIKMPDADRLFSILVLSLENTSISHTDNMVTKLFISPQGELSGTFHPDGKPWTKVLIPPDLIPTQVKTSFFPPTIPARG